MKLKENKIFRWIIIPLCISLSLFGKFLPPIPGLSNDAMGVFYIFLSSIILWLTIGIDWPSLLCIFSLGLIETLGFNSVLSSAFGNSTLIFLLFTYICTYALSKTSLIKRIAIGFVNNKIAKKSGFFFVTLFLTAVLFLGLFISPSVLFVIILPILNEILEVAQINKGDKIGKVLMMGLGFSVSISSGMTPIAHVFPLIAMNAANIDVSPFAYMGIAIPTGLLLFIIMLIFFLFIMRKDVNKFKDIDVSSLKNNLDKINKVDIVTLVTFIIVILLWIIPSLFENVSPDFYNFFNKFGTAMPPLLGVLILCIVRIDNKPILKVDDAFKNGVPWGSLIMCAATLALGAAFKNEKLGITLFLENNLKNVLVSLPNITLLIIFTLWAALQTNLSSNMVTANLVGTVASSILIATTLNLEVVICIIGMLSSFAFATPPSMPHIAMISSSEYCSTKDVLIYGIILMFISILLSLLVAYPLGTLIL